MKSHVKESGNVLFMILIGIGLFGALSYAVMSNSNSGSADRELSTLKSVRMAQYGAGLRTAIRRMSMTGTLPQSIELHTGDNITPCTTGITCVFAANGGGANVMDLGADSNIDEDGNVWRYYETADAIAVDGMGTAAADMILARFIKLNDSGAQLCRALNQGIGLDDIPGGAGIDWFDAAPATKTACVNHQDQYYVFYLVFYPL